jgi:hypothetical protein
VQSRQDVSGCEEGGRMAGVHCGDGKGAVLWGMEQDGEAWGVDSMEEGGAGEGRGEGAA